MSDTIKPELKYEGNKLVATYQLKSDTHSALLSDFELSLSHLVRNENPHLIVIDIKDGEPVWLASLLFRYAHMGLDLIVCPTGNASVGTKEAVKQIQTNATTLIARKLGYDQ